MAGSELSLGHLEGFIRAVLAELQRVVEQDRDMWSLKTHLPVVPHAAQLSGLGLMLLKGVDAGCRDVFPHRDRIEELLGKAYRESKGIWAEGLTKKKPEARDRLLNDTKTIKPVVMKAVRFAEQNFRLYGHPLSAYVSNVQDAIADLTGRITVMVEQKLRDADGRLPQNTPPAVYGALAVASLAGGMVGRRVLTTKEISAARLATRLGSEKAETTGKEPKAVKRLRGTLKELAEHLPEQRG